MPQTLGRTTVLAEMPARSYDIAKLTRFGEDSAAWDRERCMAHCYALRRNDKDYRFCECGACFREESPRLAAKDVAWAS